MGVGLTGGSMHGAGAQFGLATRNAVAAYTNTGTDVPPLQQEPSRVTTVAKDDIELLAKLAPPEPNLGRNIDVRV